MSTGEQIFDFMGFALVVLIWAGLWFFFWPFLPYHILGGLGGLGAGVMSSFSIHRRWDPVNRHWRNNHQHGATLEGLGILVPVAAALGGLTARYGLVEHLFGKPLNDFLILLASNWMGVVLTYIQVQQWRSM